MQPMYHREANSLCMPLIVTRITAAERSLIFALIGALTRITSFFHLFTSNTIRLDNFFKSTIASGDTLPPPSIYFLIKQYANLGVNEISFLS
jgi:hypothetical protein